MRTLAGLRQRDLVRYRAAGRRVQYRGPRPPALCGVPAGELVSPRHPFSGGDRVCHLLADPQRRGRPGLAAEFCAAIAEDGLRVIEATPHDYRRMGELLTTYASLRLQVVVACVIALAERLEPSSRVTSALSATTSTWFSNTRSPSS